MRKQPKSIGKENIKKELFQDILFFKIAEGGAMGEPGGVVWINSKGESFHCNYCYGDISLQELQSNFAPLKNSNFGMFGIGSTTPKGWLYVSLGMGNHLLVAESVYDEFKEAIKNLSRASEIYGHWYEVALKITNKNKEINKMKNNTTELVFILDRSGSMSGFEADTIGGFNATIEKQKEQEGKVYVSTVLFDNFSEVIHDRVDISEIKPMTREYYNVRGCTALLDAVGGAIRHIGNIHKYARPEDVPEHTIFIITTDGMENASHRYSSQDIRAKIKRQTEKYGWEFIFLAANINAVETAENIGIRRERAANYRQTKEGVERSYYAMSEAITTVRNCCAEKMDLEEYLKEDDEKAKQ